LLRALEEADDFAVLRICGHSVPESRREGWRACFDDSMEPLAHDAIRFPHPGDLREDGAFPVRLVRLQLLDALLHRDSFLVRESPERLADRGGALGGLLRFLLWAHRSILKPTCGALVKDSFPNLRAPSPRSAPLEADAHERTPTSG